jgi:hypothetical protein
MESTIEGVFARALPTKLANIKGAFHRIQANSVKCIQLNNLKSTDGFADRSIPVRPQNSKWAITEIPIHSYAPFLLWYPSSWHPLPRQWGLPSS